MRIERDEGDFVSRFIGLAFRHWRNPGEKKEGTCIEQKGDKKIKIKNEGRGEKKTIFFYSESSGLQRKKN